METTKTVLQACNECNQLFRVEYHSNGSYTYLDNPCDCESDFSPAITDDPSISEWMEETASK
jgi:hypothetical protein